MTRSPRPFAAVSSTAFTVFAHGGAGTAGRDAGYATGVMDNVISWD
ncbi:hypothetical protein AABB02_35340 [Streptomyces rimosus]